MENFYLYIFILLCFIVAVSYWTTYASSNYALVESFNSDKQSFVLLGDSILKNDAYVSDGKSVEELLVERTNGKTTCLAIDHSKIVDIYSQVDKIPKELNTSQTTVFLSAGGNDILTHYVDQGNDSTDTSILGTMFAAYKKLIKSIQKKLPNANIVLLDIYYPENMTYKQYHSIINDWNKMVYEYAAKNGLSVLKVSGVLTKPDDFSFGIEPSATGGRKLVDAILSSY
jgi:lysophospholipase L1-like esterase